MNNPEWMKPHLRARLEQERKEATRTGPVNGEKALVCENGKVKEVVTDHKPAPAKADFNVGDTSTWMHNGKPTRGTIKSVGPAHGIKTQIEVEFPDGTTEHYLVNPLPHCENSDYSKAPKNCLKPTDKVKLLVDDCRIEGIVMAIGGRLCCVAVKSVIGTVFVYRNIEELEPMPPKNGLVNERIDVEEVVEKFKELHDKYPPKLPPKNSFSPLEFGTDDDAPELGQEFFDKAIVTKPGESLVDKARGCGHFFDKIFEGLYGPFTSRFRVINGLDGKQETWEYTYDNKHKIVAKRRVS